MAAAPQQWDWAAADVPSALTPEMDQHQQAREVGPTFPYTLRPLEVFLISILLLSPAGQGGWPHFRIHTPPTQSFSGLNFSPASGPARTGLCMTGTPDQKLRATL